MGGSEHPVEAAHGTFRPRDEGGESCDERNRLEDQRAHAATPRPFQPDFDPAVRETRQPPIAPIPSPVDRLVRLLVAVRWGLAVDPSACPLWLTLGTDDAPLERRFVLGARGWKVDAKAKKAVEMRASRRTA